MNKHQRKAVVSTLRKAIEIVEASARAKPISHSAVTAPPLTAELRQEVVRLFRDGLSQQQIAARLRINQGRVSTTLRGAL